jgi:hypothetical protein
VSFIAVPLPEDNRRAAGADLDISEPRPFANDIW